MILLIDDEPSYAKVYIDEMKASGLPFRYFAGVDEAWDFLRSSKKPLDLVVIDSMMPTGDLCTVEETKGGMETGVVFLLKLREAGYDAPAFIITNLGPSMVSDEALRLAEVRYKTQVFYDEFIEEVAAAYAKRTQEEKA